MHTALSLGIGYFIGCINPAVWIGKKKHVNLKETGTGNLGATNTTLVLGRKAGVFVLLFDIFKSFFAYRLAKTLFPQLVAAGLIAGVGAILGHSFNVFLHFQGGKGLAAFGGMILAYNPWFFLGIVTTGILLMTLLNTGVAAPIMGSLVFPVLVWRHGASGSEIFWAAASGVLIFALHWTNLVKSFRRDDYVSTRDFYKDVLFHKSK